MLVGMAFVIAALMSSNAHSSISIPTLGLGAARIIVIGFALSTCMYYFDLYDSDIMRNHLELMLRLIQVMGAVCILLALIYTIDPALGISRGILVFGLTIGSFLVFGWRRLFDAINALPQFSDRTLILGDSELTSLIADELRMRPELGVHLVGQIKKLGEVIGEAYSRSTEGGDALASIRSYQPNRIIVAYNERRGNLPVKALLELKRNGVQIQDGAALYEAITGKVHIGTLRASYLLFSSSFRVSWVFLAYKRIASIILSLAGIALSTPLMLIIALAVCLDSKGPIVFKQKRVGHCGNIFTLYKFRTMVHNADQDGDYRPACISDARFTRVGRWIRRARVDELPQLFNILRGDMYFVGPRPFVINQEEECTAEIPFYQQRWELRPGATGWAQVNRGYNVTIDDNKEKLAYDLFYIKNMSAGLDLLILLKTVKILLLGRGAQ